MAPLFSCPGMSQIAGRDRPLGMYDDLFDGWSRVRRRGVASVHQLGYLEGARRRPWRRRLPPVPLLHLVVEPPGAPSSDLVLTVWSESLLSVRRGDEWMCVVDADRPLDPGWLQLLGGAGRSRAVVTFATERLTPERRFRLTTLGAHAALARVEDRRQPAASTSRAVARPERTAPSM